jgi:hypothetical protein
MSGQSLEYFTQPVSCSWGKLHFCNSSLLGLKTLITLLGRDLLSKLKVQILLPPVPREYFCMPLIEEQADPSVWMDGSTIERARQALLLRIT